MVAADDQRRLADRVAVVEILRTAGLTIAQPDKSARVDRFHDIADFVRVPLHE